MVSRAPFNTSNSYDSKSPFVYPLASCPQSSPRVHRRHLDRDTVRRRYKSVKRASREKRLPFCCRPARPALRRHSMQCQTSVAGFRQNPPTARKSPPFRPGQVRSMQKDLPPRRNPALRLRLMLDLRLRHFIVMPVFFIEAIGRGFV